MNKSYLKLKVEKQLKIAFGVILVGCILVFSILDKSAIAANYCSSSPVYVCEGNYPSVAACKIDAGVTRCDSSGAVCNACCAGSCPY